MYYVITRSPPETLVTTRDGRFPFALHFETLTRPPATHMSLSRLLSRTATASRVVRPAQTFNRRWVPRAMYSAGGGLSRESIKSRVLETLQGYEKIDNAKVSLIGGGPYLPDI